MTNGQHLLNIAQAGLDLSSGDYPEDKRFLLIVLLDLEDSLDKGRALAFDSRDLMPEINTKMDALRKRIRDILDGMDSAEAKKILEERGEAMKRQFQISQ